MTRFERGAAVVEILAAALWLGGIVALGAVAAPVVFGIVPAPYSADAMTTVFRRFDRIAMGCAVFVLVAEAGRAFVRRRSELGVRSGAVSRGAYVDVPVVLRSASAVLAAGLAVFQGMQLSPHIEALHRAGAVRGLNDLGRELNAVHHLAERVGKGQVVLLAALLALQVFTLERPNQSR